MCGRLGGKKSQALLKGSMKTSDPNAQAVLVGSMQTRLLLWFFGAQQQKTSTSTSVVENGQMCALRLAGWIIK